MGDVVCPSGWMRMAIAEAPPAQRRLQQFATVVRQAIALRRIPTWLRWARCGTTSASQPPASTNRRRSQLHTEVGRGQDGRKRLRATP